MTDRTSFIELDARRYPIERCALAWRGADWTLELRRAGEVLFLEGRAEGDRLRIDLRSLDGVLEQLQGAPITTYPGGQLVCAAHLAVRGEGGASILACETTFDWDRAIDPPGATYVEPRVLRMQFAV